MTKHVRALEEAEIVYQVQVILYLLLHPVPGKKSGTRKEKSPLYAKGDPIFQVLRDGPQILEFELRKHSH
jgi:hypothetical protein